MKYTKRISCLVLAVFLTTSFAFSQNLNEDLEAAMQFVVNAKQLKIESELKVFGGGNTSKLLSVQRAFINKNGSQFHNIIDDQIVLVNGQCHLLIHKETRMILFEYNKDIEHIEFEDFKMDTEAYSEMLKLSKQKEYQTKYFGVKGGAKHYQVESTSGDQTKVDVYLDITTKMFRKIVYNYKTFANGEWNYNKVEISYSNISTTPSFPDSFFSEDQYVLKTKTGLKPASEYSGYTLIDTGKSTF